METSAEFIRELDRFETPAALKRSILAPFQETLAVATEIYLFGASRLGQKFLSYCAKSRFRVKAFLDNNPNLWGKEIGGLRVFAPQDVPDRGIPVFVVSGYLSTILRQLKALGFSHAIPFPVLFLFSEIFKPELGYEGMCEEIILNKSRFASSYKQFRDSRSQNVFNQLIFFRTSLNSEFLESICDSDNNSERYFGHPFLSLTENPVFIDGGGYDGDSTRDFIEWCDGNYRKVLLFEPDATLMEKARARLIRNQNVCFYPCGLHSQAGRLRFDSTQGLDGRISEAGDSFIAVKSIDEFIDEKVSIIKLDIEGSEEAALRGAVNTILTHHPTLMISVYHRPSDLWRIPEIILEIYPGYDFFLRHFSQSNVATVLFAIPRK